MNSFNKTIIIVGGEGDNQAKLSTQLEPVKITDGVGIALTSIYHGEVHNINGSNNVIEYYSIFNPVEPLTVTLPPGNYPTTLSVLRRISSLISAKERTRIGDEPKCVIEVAMKREEIYVSFRNIMLGHRPIEDSPWALVGASHIKGVVDSFSVKNVTFDINVEPAFLYVNIVENSYINGKLSRVLTVIPISMKPNWSYYEFVQPNFVPISVKEFAKITLEIRNRNGKFVPFDPTFKTIVTLQTKPINRTM